MPWDLSDDEVKRATRLLSEHQAAHTEFVEAFRGSDPERLHSAAAELTRTYNGLQEFFLPSESN